MKPPPDGTLFTFRRELHWVGEWKDNTRWCLVTTDDRPQDPPVPLGQEVSRWLREMEVHLPGTPGWDEVNARVMLAMLRMGGDD